MMATKDPLESAAEKVRRFGHDAELTADEFAAYKGWLTPAGQINRRYFDDQVRAGRLVAFGACGNQRRFHLGTNIALQARKAGLKNDLIVTILANPNSEHETARSH